MIIGIQIGKKQWSFDRDYQQNPIEVLTIWLRRESPVLVEDKMMKHGEEVVEQLDSLVLIIYIEELSLLFQFDELMRILLNVTRSSVQSRKSPMVKN